MKLRVFHIAIALGLAVGAFAAFHTTTAEAGDGVDCHSLKKWDKSTEYKQDDLVWGENGDWHSAGSEYKCAPRSARCHGGYEPKTNSEFKVVGACKSGTKP